MMRSLNGRCDTGLLERHLRIVLAGLMGVERLRSGTTSGVDSAGLRICTCFPGKQKENGKLRLLFSADWLITDDSFTLTDKNF